MRYILFYLALTSLCFSQTYTVTQESSYMNPSSTSTYKVEQQGTGAYQNPQQGIVDYSAFQRGFNQSYNPVVTNTRNTIPQKASTISITKDKLSEFDYDFIVINNVYGWDSDKNKKNIYSVLLRSDKTIIYSKSKKGKFNYNKDFDETKSVFLNFERRHISNVDKSSTIKVTDIDNNILLVGEFLNVPLHIILSPFFGNKLTSTPIPSKTNSEIDKSNSAVAASIELLKLKEVYDAGLITKEEFDEKAERLKSIILK